MYRLIYKSRSTGKINWAVVENIMNTSLKNNLRDLLGGVLLATETHYLQVLEGKFEDVNRTFMRIIHDPRHTDLQLISFHAIDGRLFDHFGMRGIGVFDINQELAETLKEKYGEENGEVHFPLEEWQVLAMVQDMRMIENLPEWKK